MATILVTAEAGFISSHVAELFFADGFEVVILNLEEELQKAATHFREKEQVV